MQIIRHDTSAVPGRDDAPYQLDERLWDGVLLDLFGNTDLGASAARRIAEAAPNPYQMHISLTAVEGGAPIAVAMIDLPLAENREVALLSVAVTPGHRRRGVGGTLFEAALEEARRHGRTTFQAFTWDRLTAPGPSTMSARDGDGAIDPTAPGDAFLLHRGFTLAQVDVMSALTLPPQRELALAAADATSFVPEPYGIVQWRGDTPPSRRRDLAALMVTMSTDMPIGEASFEAEVYDERRIRALDGVLVDAGIDQIVTAAVHRPSSALVGFTRIIHDPARPHVADQWDTLVVGGHRGNGLGLAMKRVSHARLRAAWPGVTRVVTGNASENRWMLDINRSLGFAPIAASGWFERREG